MSVLILNVDELWLKGKNQPYYRTCFRQHLELLLGTFAPAGQLRTKKLNHNFVVETEEPFPEGLLPALLRLPGLASMYPAERVPLELEVLAERVVTGLAGKTRPGLTFAVTTRRANKRFPLNSMQLSAEIGGRILMAYPELRVDLGAPELRISLRVLEDGIYVHTSQFEGIGGLPAGTSGHVVVLLSGGFDSPVAAYLMAKRGCSLSFVFFHAYPYVGDEVKAKVRELVEVLCTYQQRCSLYIVNYGRIQQAIAEACDPTYRTVLFRWYMLRAAELLANKLQAEGLVTGDVLGQVSSQTLSNLALLDRATLLPVLRPLLGHNKREIIDLARRIGTHDISVRPHDDACALFAVKHPILRPSQAYLDRILSELDPRIELAACVEQAEVIECRPWRPCTI